MASPERRLESLMGYKWHETGFWKLILSQWVLSLAPFD
jgi:hypothetical protein